MEEKDQLVQLLDDELVLHRAMIPLLDEEKEILLSKKPEALLEIMKKKESIIEKIKEREHQRKTLVIALSLRLKMPQEKINISFLSGYWKDPGLEKIKNALASTLEDIQNKQQLNNALIRNAQGLIREAVGLLYMQQQQQDAVYGPQGVFHEQTKEQGYLDKNI